jgi:multicomponent Na+:H+ antiporter subunit D
MIVVAYGLATETALIGGIVHLLGHGLMKGGLFLAAGVVAVGVGARTVDEYAGLAEHRPFVAGSVAVLGLALVGVPPSIGFVGKWFIAVGAVEAGVWPVAAVIFLSTVLTLAYVARLLEKMYFTPSRRRRRAYTPENPLAADGGTGDRVSKGMFGIVIAATLLSVALGFSGGVFDSLLGPFVEGLLNG